MGKKKNKNTNISWNPLQATTIGEMKQNKYGWIGTVLLFALFIAIVFYLPELSVYYTKYFGPKDTVPTLYEGNITNETLNTTIEDKRDVEKFRLDEKNSFEFDIIDVSNIKLFSDVLTYRVANKTGEKIELGELDYFFEFYDEYGNVIQTVYVTGKLDKDGEESYSTVLRKSGDIATYSLSIIEDKYFTYFNLDADEDGAAIISCSNGYSTIVYSFVNDKLKKIDETFQYQNDEMDYTMKYDEYNKKKEYYYDIKGVEPTLEVGSEYLKYTLSIDYNLVEDVLEEVTYFPVDTSPREVKFKMEALGYSC